jgi:putative membrane protein
VPVLPLLHAASGPYQFHWNVHPDVVLLCIFVEAGYLYAVTQLRGLASDAGRVRRGQVLMFSAGVLAIYLVAGTPVHDISEQYLLSMHMVQHTVFTLVAAPLLVAGVPVWLWQAILRPRGVLPVARVLVHPVVAFTVFNAIMVLTHLPVVVNYALYHHWFHFLVHAALVGTAMMMWWPVLSTVPELPHMSAPLQMSYLFLQSIVPTVIAAFVTFADSPVYEFYEKAPRMWGLSAESDQQLGGGLMKLIGSLILWGLIAVVFFQWYAREQSESQEPRWDDVEEELSQLGLTSTGGKK